MNPFSISCQHFAACSGCLYDSCLEPPEIFERAKLFFQSNSSVNLTLKTGPVRFWRTRAKLAVRNENQEPVIGLFKKQSHDTLSIPNCQVHSPLINEAVKQLKKALKQTTLTYYDERSHQGDLRYLQCLVERRTGRVQLSLVLNYPENDVWKQFCHDLYTRDPQFWHSIWINCNEAKNNVIFGTKWIKVIGEPYVWENIYGKEFAFRPDHFGQANLPMYEQMISDIDHHLQSGLKVADLYAGIGIIGTCLVEKSSSTCCIEIQEQASASFYASRDTLKPSEQNKLSYVVSPAEKSLEKLNGFDACIVDPPRKGLGEKTFNELLSIQSLKQIVYVSCDWNSFERDCKYMLKNHSEWIIENAISYLFFPGTNQIETAVFLKRGKSTKDI